ncbi:MAG TPA: hypothetical protein VF104_00635 [Burkholderiales bacterium]
MVERDDRELDDFLRGGSRLSAAYREAGSDEPGADLDEVLLEKARREMHLGPKVAWSPFTSAWSRPLRLAAVLVVSVTVTLILYEQVGEPLPVPAKPAVDVPLAGSRQAPKPVEPPVRAAPAPKATAPVPTPAAPGAAEERATDRARQQAPARSTPGPAAPSTETAPDLHRLELKEMAAPAARAKEEAARGTDLGADPEAWVRRIEALRKEGRDAEADALLVQFRRRFPDYPPEKLPR